MAVIITGVLCGIAGTFISISLSSSFVRDITAGMGFMALAALIFANLARLARTRCLPAFWLPAGQRHIPAGQAIVRRGHPVQFINMLPYLMTVVLLAGFIGKSIPPRASGLPYIKDR